MPLRSIFIVCLLTLAACDCGQGTGQGADAGPDASVGPRPCISELDCPADQHCENLVCVDGEPPRPDAGFVCQSDKDCLKFQRCVVSTGECVPPVNSDAGEVDAGPPPPCQPDLEVSCGVSKLGECRLGLSVCAGSDAGWAFTACAGDLGPSAEVCDGLDNDCDGLVDEDVAPLACGVGGCARTVPGCVAGLPNTCIPGPSAPETCDGVDNDCDGTVDEGLLPLTCGVGECARSTVACQAGLPLVCVPGGTTAELCNSRDDDCNGLVDDGLGTLSCGVGACARTVPACQGGQPRACVPGAPGTEVCNNLDDDCNSLTDEGLGMLSCGVGECARTVAVCLNGTLQVCTPGPSTVESCNLLDDDCDGQVDNGLGQLSCGVGACARTVSACVGGVTQTCTPGASGTEICNGQDDDCDGQTDEDQPQLSCGLGVCARTVASCVAGAPQVCTPGASGTEICNGLDDNCDGQVDEGCNCTNGQTRACYSGPPATQGVGLCAAGIQTCVSGNWASCLGQVLPGTEVCNGSDDDCDGLTDEALGTISCGVGACARTVNACQGGVGQSCIAGVGTTEVCDGVDNDCDGQVDQGLGALSCGTGACARTVAACVSGVPQACVPGASGPEVCDGVDNNCDGQTDEGLGVLTCGTGACARTAAACVGGVGQTCTPGAAVAEICDGADNDCDGLVDEDFGPVSCGQGVCARTVASCVAGVSQVCTPGAASSELCNMLDDDCDGTVDNGTCGPVAVCPGAQTLNPNTTVTLNASASSPVGRPLSCAWTVVSRPATSNGTITNPNSCAGATYFADVVGTHVLRYTVTDSLGVTTSCTVTFTVVALGDLWVELTWSANNDMDLHLLHPSAGNRRTASSWNAAPWDCYWSNTTASWDGPGTVDDPSLDRDDITGRGPENTRINVPATNHTYAIGVHMYSWAATPTPISTTVKVYCGGQLKATQTRTFTTVKQMWVVGVVDFQGAGALGCFFTPDGHLMQVP